MLAHDTVEEFWNIEDFKECCSIANSDSISRFRTNFLNYIGCRHKNILFMNSGREALKKILKIVKRKTKSKYVAVSGFNCEVVLSAIKEARMEPLFIDFSKSNGKTDWTKEDEIFSYDLGAIIVTHFFGVPTEFDSIIARCKKNNIFIIEDCAHSLGAKINNKIVGTIGDASIYSFNYDKPISLGWGGCLVVNNQCLVDDDDFIDDLPVPFNIEKKLMMNFINKMRYRRLYIKYTNKWYFRVLRKLKVLPSSIFNIPLSYGMGSIRAELGSRCLFNYEKEMIIRANNVNKIISSAPELDHWYIGETVLPKWLKLKISTSSKNDCKNKMLKLQTLGIRAGNFNWSKLLSDNNISMPNSFTTSEQWIEVPIHSKLHEKDIKNIIEVIKSRKTNE